jgi:hypothetical protein
MFRAPHLFVDPTATAVVGTPKFAWANIAHRTLRRAWRLDYTIAQEQRPTCRNPLTLG